MNDQLLEQCFADLAAGESLEACLARYPQQREELEPVLRAALLLRAARTVTAPPAFRKTARGRLLERIEAKPPVSQKPGVGLAGSWRSLLDWFRRPLAVPALAPVALVLTLIFLGTTATAYAAQNALPDGSLYGVKLLTEDIRLALSSDPGELRLMLAQRRLEEALALQESGRDAYVPATLDRYAQSLQIWERLAEQSELRDPGRVAERFRAQLLRLQQLAQRAPVEQQELIQQQEQDMIRVMRQIAPKSKFLPTVTPTLTPLPAHENQPAHPEATSTPRRRVTPAPTMTPNRDHMTPESTETPGGGHMTPEATKTPGGGHMTPEATETPGDGHMTPEPTKTPGSDGHMTPEATMTPGGGHMTPEPMKTPDGGGHMTPEATETPGDGRMTPEAARTPGGGHGGNGRG